MRTQVSLLGGGQLLLSALLIASLCFLLGFSWQLSLLLGLTLGLSSTAFAVQLMDEQGIMGSQLGRRGFAILLLQDLAVIPLLILVSAFAPSVAGNTHEAQLPWWLAPLAVIAILLIGKYLLNPILKLIAGSNVRELLTAASLFIVLGTAFLMQSVGMSMGMGAFLAGIVLANSSFRHQLEADIEPFKGLLLGLFFIAVGMTLDLQLLFAKPLLIFALALVLMLLKTLVIAMLLRIQKIPLREGFYLGLMLSQGGEFAFVVLASMVELGVSEAWVRNYTVIVVGVSMALTSPLVMLYKLLDRDKPKAQREFDKIESEDPEVIICGLGRFGQIIARMLAANGLHFAALDKDPTHVDFVKQFGNTIYYGDATRLDLLEAAGLHKARVVVVAVDNIEQSIEIVEKLRAVRPDIKIVARARNRFHVYQLLNFKVDYIVRETFESALLAASDTLQLLGFTEGQALNKLDIFRKHDEAMMARSAEHRGDLVKLQDIAKQGRLELEELFKKDASV